MPDRHTLAPERVALSDVAGWTRERSWWEDG